MFISVPSCAFLRHGPYRLPCLGLSYGGGERSRVRADLLGKSESQKQAGLSHTEKRAGKEGKIIPRNCLRLFFEIFRSFWFGDNDF